MKRLAVDGVIALMTFTISGCAAKDRISAGELASGLAERPEDFYLVDVRSDREFHGARGHIEGATHLPWPSGVRDSAHTLDPEPDQKVVLICFTGHRSRWAMERIREAVSNEVIDLKGGMIRWWSGDHPVVVESGGSE